MSKRFCLRQLLLFFGISLLICGSLSVSASAMTSDELQAWNEAISESFAQGEVYTVQSTPAGSVRAVAVSELESVWNGYSSGYDLDGNFVTFDFSDVAGVSRPVLRRAASSTVNASTGWSWSIPADGMDYWNYMPSLGCDLSGNVNDFAAWGGGSVSNSTEFYTANTERCHYIGSGLAGSTQYTSVFSNFGFRVEWLMSASVVGWPGYYTTNIYYAQKAFEGQFALDAVIRPYQSWWAVSSSDSFSDITEKFRHTPKTISLLLSNSDGGGYVYYASGSEIADGVYFWAEKQSNGAYHVWFGSSDKTVVPLEFSSADAWTFGFSLQFGTDVTSIGYGNKPVWSSVESYLSDSPGSSAFQQLSSDKHYGWSVVSVWNWDSGAAVLTKGASLQDIYDAIQGNTSAIEKAGGEIVSAIDGLPGKIASGLTPSEDDVKSGVSSVQSKFAASYGNTKSLVDMVENLYITLKDGFSGASEVTTWDFPGIKVKLNGTVHTICPEMAVQKTDIGMQQYLVLVVRVICVIALVWMIWNKVHRVIVPKEADD